VQAKDGPKDVPGAAAPAHDVPREADGSPAGRAGDSTAVLVPQDIHGWTSVRSRQVTRQVPSGFLGLGTKTVVEVVDEVDDASRVQALQLQVADALGRPVAFRDRLKVTGEGPELVIIPPGRFRMGSPHDEPERSSDEGPQHPVTLTRPFALARYALTFEEYDAYCAATGKDRPSDSGWGRGKRPVISVSWDDQPC
jgi:formylglycine-generating enzyme required for sulfatase activity